MNELVRRSSVAQEEIAGAQEFRTENKNSNFHSLYARWSEDSSQQNTTAQHQDTSSGISVYESRLTNCKESGALGTVSPTLFQIELH